MKAEYRKYDLIFKQAAITSRNTLLKKETYFIKVWDEENPTLCGRGEASLFRGLSAEDCPQYEAKLQEACENIDSLNLLELKEWSSILFGVETAIADLKSGCRCQLYDTPFTRGEEGIRINGLIWMGNKEEMLDVTDDSNFDWNGFYEKMDQRYRRFENSIKFDVNDQVQYYFENFVVYCWNNK